MRWMRAATVAMALTLVGAAPAADAFDRAVIALTNGVRAADNHDKARLRAAAQDLRASAAQPVAGADMAMLWLREAGSTDRPVDRNRALGPGYRSLQLGGGRSVTFQQTFLAGQVARIAVIPSPRSDFVMRVSEDDRTPLCSASRAKARCDWVPSYTSRFRIELSNPGRQPGRYFLMVQ